MRAHFDGVRETLYMIQAILCYTLMVLTMSMDNRKLLRDMVTDKKEKYIQSPLPVCVHACSIPGSYCSPLLTAHTSTTQPSSSFTPPNLSLMSDSVFLTISPYKSYSRHSYQYFIVLLSTYSFKFMLFYYLINTIVENRL